MKVSGNDVDFIVDLGTEYAFNFIQLDQAIFENLYLNMYEGKEDFRDLSFQFQGITYKIRVDQHLNLDQIQGFINEDPQVKLANILCNRVNYAVVDGKSILQFRFLRNGAIGNTTLIGDGWNKLGMQTGVIRQLHTGVNCYDLLQSPAILIQFENIPNVLKTKYGSYSFSINNTSTFGQRIYYQSTQEISCQHIYLPHEVNVSQLHIRLLNCDMKLLETARQNAVATNQTNNECIFVFTLKKL